jgi:hypothetical protein
MELAMIQNAHHTKPLSMPVRDVISVHYMQQYPPFVPTGLRKPLGITIAYPHVAPSGASSLPPIQNQ